jgi:hypothetical protein
VAKTSTTTTTYDRAPDHAVMSGAKEQLQALPLFRYSDYDWSGNEKKARPGLLRGGLEILSICAER